MKTKYDIIIIGGGALGTFHAYYALQKGYRVCIIEKNKFAKSATTQNFGQVVPSGMNTKWQNYGRVSLELYKEIQSQFDITVRQNGSIYLASNKEELLLIEELHQINQKNEYTSQLLSKKECLSKYHGLREDYVIGGLFFPQEITIEPRTMIHKLHQWMVDKMGLELITNTTIINCETYSNYVTALAANKTIYEASKIIICNGKDFKILYPDLFEKTDLEIVKLQMMQTKPQKKMSLKGAILTGWSIRRYEAFAECPSYKEIKTKEAAESLQKKWGVHILFKQAVDGSIIIGDSHEYADIKNEDDLGFDLNMDIDNFIIEECKKIIELPSYEIQNRWIGKYSQCKNSDIFNEQIDTNIHVVTGIGGKGMTGSAGFAKENISKILN